MSALEIILLAIEPIRILLHSRLSFYLQGDNPYNEAFMETVSQNSEGFLTLFAVVALGYIAYRVYFFMFRQVARVVFIALVAMAVVYVLVTWGN